MTTPNFQKLALVTLISLTTTMSGCSTLNVFKKKEDVVAHAETSEEGYYAEAQEAIAKGRYNQASLALTNLRTFYPTGRYAQQALLDLIHVYYNRNDHEALTTTTNQFINSYPTSPHVDYALYAQGVTNMDGSPKAGRIFRLDQSQRDTAYLRLAFADFQKLITHYPNSVYAPDAAQRMTHIYNQFAEHELQAAEWYIKREAYVAAAERARWVFQYYPQSSATPKAIAILAYANEQLGLATTANQYKTLLQINYPQYLSSDGKVRLDNDRARSLWQRTLHSVSFGKLGRATDKDTGQPISTHDGQTRPQVIQNAQGLQLAPTNTSNQALPNLTNSSRGMQFGLGLSQSDSEAGNNSPHAVASDAINGTPTQIQRQAPSQ